MTIDERLVGTWRVEAFEFTDAGGAVFRPLGEHPEGFVMFSADGTMAFCFQAAGRAGFAAEDLFGGSAEERAAAAAGCVAFGGPCRTENGAVTVDVAFSLFPNWVGGSQTRLYEVEGDRLRLRTTGPRVFAGVERRGEARLERVRH
jgi:hypothetical protein